MTVWLEFYCEALRVAFARFANELLEKQVLKFAIFYQKLRELHRRLFLFVFVP